MGKWELWVRELLGHLPETQRYLGLVSKPFVPTWVLMWLEGLGLGLWLATIRGGKNMILSGNYEQGLMFMFSFSLDIVSLWSRCGYQLMIVTFVRPQVTHEASGSREHCHEKWRVIKRKNQLVTNLSGPWAKPVIF